MEAENENDKLKKLLQESCIGESVPADFTEKTIRLIEAASAENFALKSLLQNHAIETVPTDFQQNIIAQLAIAKPITPAKPLIPLRVWYWVAAVFAVLIIAGFAYPSFGSEQSWPIFEAASRIYFPKLTASLAEIIIPTFAGFTVLLFLDFALRPAHKKLARPSGSG